MRFLQLIKLPKISWVNSNRSANSQGNLSMIDFAKYDFDHIEIKPARTISSHRLQGPELRIAKRRSQRILSVDRSGAIYIGEVINVHDL
jgi:hypothetical protein